MHPDLLKQTLSCIEMYDSMAVMLLMLFFTQYTCPWSFSSSASSSWLVFHVERLAWPDFSENTYMCFSYFVPGADGNGRGEANRSFSQQPCFCDIRVGNSMLLSCNNGRLLFGLRSRFFSFHFHLLNEKSNRSHWIPDIQKPEPHLMLKFVF